MTTPNRYKKYRPLKYKQLSDSWQNILLREMNHASDGWYADWLRVAIADMVSSLVLGNHSRPFITEVELALYQACREDTATKDIWQPWLQQLYREKHKATTVEMLIEQLDSDYWLERFMARHLLVHRGGEAVEALRQIVDEALPNHKDTALWLLKSIEFETTARLAQKEDQLYCKRCFTFCQRQWVDLSWRPDPFFYGCRTCRQSLDFFVCSRGVVAVLDNKGAEAYSFKNGLLRVNWFRHRKIFDFDRVEIIRATDEEIERFAMRVGNDIDPYRKPRYSRMQCKIGVDCNLSKNSQRIVTSIFGQIT